MIFVTIEEVDAILGENWTEQDKKAMAVNQANVWLSSKCFCKGVHPSIDDSIKQAGAYLANLSAKGLLYVSRTDGLVSEKTVKADTVQVTKKYAEGQETAASSEMLFIDDILKPFLCSGVVSFNSRICK